MRDVRKTFSAHSMKAIFIAFFVAAAEGAAANPTVVDNQFRDVDEVRQKSEIGITNGSFIAVPVPFSNPAIGSGLALGGGYLFRLGSDEDTSFVGIGAMGSENGSFAYGAAINLSFESGWRFDFALAEADIQYDLFFGPVKLPIRQDGSLVNAGLDYSLSETVSVGGAVRYLDSSIRLNSAGTFIPDELVPDLKLELASLGGRFAWDTRDDSDYPTHGARLGVTLNFGQTVSGLSRSYVYSIANLDYYRSPRPDGVLAARVSACAASSEAPFFDQCSIGFSDSFRGFSPTQFYDARLLSSQIEYRRRLGGRFGLVIFAGVGWTGPSFGSLTDNGERAAAGLGLRYRLSKQFPIDFSVDVSTNNDDEEFLYIYAGQRF